MTRSSSSEVNSVLVLMTSWVSGISGGDVHILQMLARWQKRAQLTVVAPEDARFLLEKYAPKANLKTFQTSRLSAGTVGQAIDYLQRLSRIRRIVRNVGDQDLVLAASHFLPDSVGLVTSKSKRKSAYVYHLSTFAARGISTRSIFAIVAERLSVKILQKSVDSFVVTNEQVRLELARMSPTYKTDLGFDLAQWSKATVRQNRMVDVTYVGRLVAPKGVEDFIRVIEKIRTSHPKLQAVVAGDGPERTKLEEVTKKLGLTKHISFTGWIDDDEKQELLAQSRVFLFPSYEEGWGIAVCEALASGCHVVAYDLPVYNELFPGLIKTVRRGDIESLSEATTDVLKDEHSQTSLTEIQLALQKYDLDKVADSEWNYYTSL